MIQKRINIFRGKTMDDKLNILNHEIKEVITSYLKEEGVFQTPVPNVFFVRKTPQNQVEKCLEQPLLSLILQGEKSSIIGNQQVELTKNMIIVSSIDLPASSYVIKKDSAEEFISMFIYFDSNTLVELIMEMEKNNVTFNSSNKSFSVEKADEDIMECMLRLAKLVYTPHQIKLRAQMIIRELYYLLLSGNAGDMLAATFMKGSEKNQIMKIISKIKEQLNKPLEINILAQHANMSISNLYRYFKLITGLSPLQYQKQLRLYEAQRLMLIEKEKAASAAYLVGYESVTQFNREYKRMFGKPPHQDIKQKTLQL